MTLALTIAVESLALAAFARRWRMTDLLYVTLVNALTNPLVVYCHQTVLRAWPWWEGFMLLEALAWAVEVPLYAALLQWPLRRAAGLSAVANGLSAVLTFVV